jgi:mannan endo-1,4-beta-mannosidase
MLRALIPRLSRLDPRQGSPRKARLSAACLGLAGIGAALAAAPANPKAMPDAIRILNYYESLPAKTEAKVISGQFAGWGNDLPSGYRNDVAGLQGKAGKWVALLGTDWHDFNSGTGITLPTLIDWWKTGGLVTISYHMDNPFNGSNSWNTQGNLADLLKAGTATHRNYLAILDRTAGALKTLKDNGVIVLWRPFHEQNGGWFWWGNKNPDDFVAAWRHMFDYFTTTKGLDNLLWVFSPNYGAGVDRYYPGDAYCDILGLDAYFDRPTAFTLTGYAEMTAHNKPFGITEFGGVPAAGGSNNVFDNTVLIKEIRAKYPKTSFFMNWHCPWSIACQQKAPELMNDPWVIDRSELGWKSMSATVAIDRVPASLVRNPGLGGGRLHTLDGKAVGARRGRASGLRNGVYLEREGGVGAGRKVMVLGGSP